MGRLKGRRRLNLGGHHRMAGRLDRLERFLRRHPAVLPTVVVVGFFAVMVGHVLWSSPPVPRAPVRMVRDDDGGVRCLDGRPLYGIGGRPWHGQILKQADVPLPSQTYTMMDSHYGSSYPKRGTPFVWYPSSSLDAEGDPRVSGLHFRHNAKSANFAFADGHVENRGPWEAIPYLYGSSNGYAAIKEPPFGWPWK